MLIWQSALEISGLVRAKKLSPIEVTDAVLSRIDAVNPTLNAFCVVAAEQARAAAREAEIAVTKGEPLGPLPAAFCGVYGFKPSYGRVPEGRGFPGGFAGVSHVGPITRTVRDAALVLDVIAGGDDRDRHSLPREAGSYLEACDGRVKGLNVAWTSDLGYARVDPRVVELAGDAAAEFESLGCHVEVVNPGWEDPEEFFGTMIAAQFYAAWSDRLPEAEALMDPTLVKFIRRGGAVTARDYLRARERAG